MMIYVGALLLSVITTLGSFAFTVAKRYDLATLSIGWAVLLRQIAASEKPND